MNTAARITLALALAVAVQAQTSVTGGTAVTSGPWTDNGSTVSTTRNVNVGNTLPGTPVSRSLNSKVSDIISVKDYGAVADSNGSHGNGTDNAAAIAAAIAAVPTGGTLYFPCQGGSYRTTQPVSFTAKQYVTFRGSNGHACQIVYDGASAQTASFTLVGSYWLTFENLQLASTSTNPSRVLLLLGRSAAPSAAGNHTFHKFELDGYATTALVYSVASEENNFEDIDFTLRGGGAKFVFLTAQSDVLSVASLPTSTNTVQWMSKFHLRNYSATITTDAAVVYDVVDTDSGDHSYVDGYISSAGGSGIEFHGSGVNQTTPIIVEHVRFENQTQSVFHLTTASSGISLRLRHNSTRSGPAYCMYGDDNTTLLDSIVTGNDCYTVGSSFYDVTASTIDEAHNANIVVRHAASSSQLTHRLSPYLIDLSKATSYGSVVRQPLGRGATNCRVFSVSNNGSHWTVAVDGSSPVVSDAFSGSSQIIELMGLQGTDVVTGVDVKTTSAWSGSGFASMYLTIVDNIGGGTTYYGINGYHLDGTVSNANFLSSGALFKHATYAGSHVRAQLDANQTWSTAPFTGAVDIHVCTVTM